MTNTSFLIWTSCRAKNTSHFPEGQSIRFGQVIDMISCDHGPRSRHVLANEVGVAGNMLSHKAAISAGPKIVIITGEITDNNPDGFTLVEGALRIQFIGCDEKEKSDEQLFHRHSFHACVNTGSNLTQRSD